MNPEVDHYLRNAVGWPDEIGALRPILLGCGLGETVKWNKPCYVDEGSNIAIIQEMKAFLALMFFKGALLDDPDGVLQEQGPNSRSARRMTFTSVGDVHRLESSIVGLVRQAVAVERAGLAAPTPPPLELVAELRERLDADPHLAAAFDRLTPGRQRQYHLHIAGAKQSTTRRSRVDACIAQILAGKGLRDR